LRGGAGMERELSAGEAAGGPKGRERSAGMGRRGGGNGERLAWRIKYRYDNRT
jgi:hypothetical protein